MKKLTEYDKRTVAEVADAVGFVIIRCDSKLPCEESKHGMCTEDHQFDVTPHNIDHQHAVDILQQVRNTIMHEGIK